METSKDVNTKGIETEIETEQMEYRIETEHDERISIEEESKLEETETGTEEKKIPPIPPSPAGAPSVEAPSVDYKFKVAKIDSKINVYDSAGNIVFDGTDATKSIQYALDNLTPGRKAQEKVLAVGNFSATDTIKMPSFVIFELQGSITLGNRINKWVVTDKTGGITDIEMIGGTYDGNKSQQNPKALSDHVIRFSKVINSHFKDMVIQNAVNDNFTLDIGCNNNICENLTGKWAGTGQSTTNDGNGLDDKGEHNTWVNCSAEDNFSDCWVIKCNNSTFQGCTGKGSQKTVGFGYFVDKGHKTANGNKFINCKAYNNARSGIAINIPSGAAGLGATIQNNSFQGEFYKNGTSGIRFTNATKDGIVSNNQIDVYCHDNPENGLFIQPSNVKNIKGSIVAINNKPNDVDIQKGSGININVYIPVGKNTNIKQGTNKIQKIGFDCHNVPAVFCTKRYCGII